ncbi:MAG: glycosyltransferase [Phycisphaeraceae bacterium]|nr:glycosyltransferase [Phycisphaeraceae bacterium]
MNVMLTELGIFDTVGGGQVAYQKLIAANPDVTFYFPVIGLGQIDSGLPNAKPFVLQPAGIRLRPSSNPLESHVLFDSFLYAERLAAAAKDLSIDVVDSPDYSCRSLFVRPAFARQGIPVPKVVRALHGVLSKALHLGWGSHSSELVAAIRLVESWCYRTSDVRYGISCQYISDWHTRTGFRAAYLDPMHMFEPPTAREWPRGGGPPDFAFIARRERRKGADLFADLMWWLGPKNVGKLRMMGSSDNQGDSVRSDDILRTMAWRRGIELDLQSNWTKDQLADLFATRVAHVVPSRWDSLSLVALESLFAGCPTAISSGAGVTGLLRARFPSVPWIPIDVHNPHACQEELADLARHYDAHRQKLTDAVSSLDLTPGGPSLAEIYSMPSSQDPRIHATINDSYANALSMVGQVSLGFAVATRAARWNPAVGRLAVRKAKRARWYWRNRSNLLDRGGKWLISKVSKKNTSLLKQARYSMRLESMFGWLSTVKEKTPVEWNLKCEALEDAAQRYRVARIRIYRLLAALENKRGRDLIAAVYKLRCMRWLGRDTLGDCSDVAETFRKHGFECEAEIVLAMFHPVLGTKARRAELLEQIPARVRSNTPVKFEAMEDNRTASKPRASVIVSLYNAADKIDAFMARLELQTLLKKGQMEIILIDSGSPKDELGALRQFLGSNAKRASLPVAYARTHERETIQLAWNRGLSLARAPFVAMLGVDEAVRPDGLEILANELDADSSLDWVTGDAIVTSVDKRGVLDTDVMTYTRQGFHKDLHFLECCYYSYVGAMYRKSLHDREGYYDPSFRAAGDTEFKNRVLPTLKAKHLAQVLGVFLNYPEGRTTLHPRAEIEDLRAWYLHRTDAGVERLFRGRDPKEARRLLHDTLKYRKSFCWHWSSDIEVALLLSRYLDERDDKSPSITPQLEQVIEIYRNLEWLANIRPRKAAASVLRSARQIHKLSKVIQTRLGTKDSVEFCFENDNRYEQHSSPWRSED